MNSRTTPPFFCNTSLVYNRLLEVEEAAKKLEQNTRFESFYNEAESMIHQFGLQDHVGLVLLHRHNHLEMGKIMLRNFSTDHTKLYTHPINKTQAQNAYPASWAIVIEENNKKFHTIEWSSTASAQINFERIQKSDFIHHYSNLLDQYKLTNLIGLTTSWPSQMNFDPSKQILIEENIFSDKTFLTNTINPKYTESVSTENLITTNWFFGLAKSDSKCRLKPVRFESKCDPAINGHPKVRKPIKWEHESPNS